MGDEGPNLIPSSDQFVGYDATTWHQLGPRIVRCPRSGPSHGCTLAREHASADVRERHTAQGLSKCCKGAVSLSQSSDFTVG